MREATREFFFLVPVDMGSTKFALPRLCNPWVSLQNLVCRAPLARSLLRLACAAYITVVLIFR